MDVKKLLNGCLALALIFGCFAGTLQADAWDAGEMDWPHWRGPEMNGISREKGLVESWDPDGQNLLWKREDLGSRSTPIVMNGKLYMMVRHNADSEEEQEKVVCVDAVTGKTIWESIFKVFLSDVPDTRVAWSSVVGDPKTGRVYALGVCGYFQCLDGATGKTIWSHSLSEENGLLSTYGGRTNFPVIHGDLVIISAIVIGWGEMAKPAHRFVAFHKDNGQPVWFNGTRLLPYDTTYSSPVTTVINGQNLMIFGSGDGGVHAMQPQTGKVVWTYNVSRRGLNVTPLVYNNTVISGHSEENINDTAMGAFFAIDATKAGNVSESGELWRTKEWFVGKSSPIVVNDRIYAIEDKAQLRIVDPKTGEQILKKKLGTMMRSSPLYADGKIYTCTANGRWYILKPTDDGVDILHRLRFSGEESHGSPIVSHGRIYFPTTGALYCIGKEGQQPSTDPRPARPMVTPASEDQTPAHVQISPVESLLKPGAKGQKQKYTVKLFNKNGQMIKRVDPKNVEFSIDGPGKITKGGVYLTPDEAVHVAVRVTAKVGELTGSARIRVVPSLPWNFDFSDGQIPITWVGARYRHVPVDYATFTALNAKDLQAGQLYLYLMSNFVNSGRPALKFDDATPRQTWNQLLIFLGLDGQLNALDEAKAKLDPSLKHVMEAGIIKQWTWNITGENKFELLVPKGDRGIDKNGVMVKIKTIPKGTRSQSWMGHPNFKNYTIQADVMGATKDGKMPDIGLIGQRYTLDMMGASQQLQIRTWPPQLYMAKTIPFEWKSETWYTMKLQTSVKGKKAVLRGKVWPRGTDEPAEWMLEAEDDIPNVQGSPGLFGNAKDAEIFYDNIKVYAN
ncbi:MAG: pyrrolo-quinoline quinone [Planctomycetaceae bacterium]|nr:pyrrolo-quinoline quinone [Planctomycetaceae bacterium]